MARRWGVIAILASVLSLVAFPAAGAFRMDLRPGYGVTALMWLSDWNPNLKGTDYDTPVYVMDSGNPGAVALVIAGTHPREIGAVTAATILLEQGEVAQGKLFVIPCLNAAGMATKDQMGKMAQQLPIEGRSGWRFLTYGDRYVPLSPGEEDPERYVHPSGFVIGDGMEWRNVNRNYPGKPDGTPSQRIAFGVMELIRSEKVQWCLDMHESRTTEHYLDRKTGEIQPGGMLAYSLITHPKGLELGVETLFRLEDRGMKLKLDQSAPGFRGICHYEIGEGTECIPFLSETPNPAMDSWRENPDTMTDPQYLLETRAGTTLEVLSTLAQVCSEAMDPLVLSNLPTKEQLEKEGLSRWLY